MTDSPGFERLTATDAHVFDCWMHQAAGASKGGIVILQEIFGVNDQLKGLAATYAGLGYNIAIPALFDRRAPGTVIPFDQGPTGSALTRSLPPDEVMGDVSAAVAALAGKGGKVAVIGFCWGGGLAVRAAQVCDIAAAVVFYGTRLNSYLADDLKAPLQFHAGAQDDHIPAELRDAFTARYPVAEMFVYEAGHAFANDARPSYRPEIAKAAHRRAQAFLAQALA